MLCICGLYLENRLATLRFKCIVFPLGMGDFKVQSKGVVSGSQIQLENTMLTHLYSRWSCCQRTRRRCRTNSLMCTGWKVLVPTRSLEGCQRVHKLGLKVIHSEWCIVFVHSNSLLPSRVGSAWSCNYAPFYGGKFCEKCYQTLFGSQ